MSQTQLTTREGDLRGGTSRFALVVARWNSFVVDQLLDGALSALRGHGVGDDQIELIRVPGAFEIPLACQAAARRNDIDAVIALGAVIRGGTPHFEFVAGECTRGISQVALETGKPVTFGVLTVDNIDQAVERSQTPPGDNKGVEAALSALEMVNLLSVMRAE